MAKIHKSFKTTLAKLKIIWVFKYKFVILQSLAFLC